MARGKVALEKEGEVGQLSGLLGGVPSQVNMSLSSGIFGCTLHHIWQVWVELAVSLSAGGRTIRSFRTPLQCAGDMVVAFARVFYSSDFPGVGGHIRNAGIEPSDWSKFLQTVSSFKLCWMPAFKTPGVAQGSSWSPQAKGPKGVKRREESQRPCSDLALTCVFCDPITSGQH